MLSPTNLTELYFPADSSASEVVPRDAQLAELSRPWTANQLFDAGEIAIMRLSRANQKPLARAMSQQLNDPNWFSSFVARHREEFYVQRNGGPLSNLQLDILNGHIEQARELLRSGVHESTVMPSLHTAAPEGSGAMIQALIGAGASIDTTNPLGETAVHLTTASGNVDGLMELLRLGANAKTADKQGVTPLMLAIKSRNAACIELLLPRSDLNARDAHGDDAMAYQPQFYVDPDDDDFDDALRYVALLNSLEEAAKMAQVACPATQTTQPAQKKGL